MELRWSDEEIAFRAEVREFVRNELPVELRRRVLAHEPTGKQDYQAWQRILYRKGWMGWNWPTEYGGPGWGQAKIYIFEEECWLGGAPEVLAFGPKMLAPLLMKFGSDAQKKTYLPRILSGEDWWCQGYSEPGAGSDLASLKTTAVRDGDEYVVNGQKTWTTYGQYADRIFCLVRTDSSVASQRGISFLLIDMDTPGITVRPIILLDGVHEVNEVFFENVRVPAENLVGIENDGWQYAKSLLGDERINAGKIGRSKRELRLLKSIAGLQREGDTTLLSNPRFAERIAQFEVDLLALEYMTLLLIANASKGLGVGAEASLLKLRGTEIAQAISAALIDAVGPDLDDRDSLDNGLPCGLALVKQYLNWRKLSIYGGSNEIQHNITARFALHL